MQTTPSLLESFSAEYIQRNFFRTGPYTHLHIQHCTASGTLAWTFTFMDFGMYHIVESTAHVEAYHGDEHIAKILVNGTPHDSPESACDALSAGHFRRFVDEMHADIGLTPPHEDTADSARQHAAGV
jgi:hypothetical protein